MIWLYLYLGSLIISFVTVAWIMGDELRTGSNESGWVIFTLSVLLWPIVILFLMAAGLQRIARYIAGRGNTDRAKIKATFVRKRREYFERKLVQERAQLRRQINAGTIR